MQPTIQRVREAGLRGLTAGVIFGGIALVIGLFTGGATYQHFGVRPFAITAIYVFGGLVGGALIGLLQPIVKSSWSAAFVATIGFLPMVLLVRCAVDGFTGLRLSQVAFLLLLAAFLGSIWGPGVWRAHQKEAQALENAHRRNGS